MKNNETTFDHLLRASQTEYYENLWCVCPTLVSAQEEFTNFKKFLQEKSGEKEHKEKGERIIQLLNTTIRFISTSTFKKGNAMLGYKKTGYFNCC